MVFLLHRCSQVAEAIFAARVERITSRQLEVLVIVRRNPGVSQADICQLSGIDRSTLSDVVGRLMSHGLLMRQRHADDARQYEVRPTERGLDLLERLMPELDNIEEALVSELSNEERSSLMALLQRLSTSAFARDSNVVASQRSNEGDQKKHERFVPDLGPPSTARTQASASAATNPAEIED